MYGLKSDPKIDALKGQSLVQVCFGENDLFLNFSGEISIGVYSSIGFGSDSKSLVKYEAFSAVSKDLLELLAAEVADVSWKADGTITLVFQGGKMVEVYDDSEQFESYTIKSPSGLVVV